MSFYQRLFWQKEKKTNLWTNKNDKIVIKILTLNEKFDYFSPFSINFKIHPFFHWSLKNEMKYFQLKMVEYFIDFCDKFKI